MPLLEKRGGNRLGNAAKDVPGFLEESRGGKAFRVATDSPRIPCPALEITHRGGEAFDFGTVEKDPGLVLHDGLERPAVAEGDDRLAAGLASTGTIPKSSLPGKT